MREKSDQCLTSKGKMSEPSWRSKHQVVFEDEHDDTTDLDCSIASVSKSDWEANVDANMSAAFDVTPSVGKSPNFSLHVSFCCALNIRGGISKLSASIGSFNIFSELYPCSTLTNLLFKNRKKFNLQSS